MEEILMNALVGAGFGLFTAIGGILKNKADPYTWSGIDWGKFAPTIVITAVAGAIIGYQGMPLTETSIASVVAGLSTVGLRELINNYVKALIRWVNNE